MKKVNQDPFSNGTIDWPPQGERLRNFHLRKSLRTTVRSRRYGLKMEVFDNFDLIEIFGFNNDKT